LDKSKDNEEVYNNTNAGGASVTEQMVDEDTDGKTNPADDSCSLPLQGNVSDDVEVSPIEIDVSRPLQDFPHSLRIQSIDEFGPASSTEYSRPPRADPRGTKKSRPCDLK
jgi:hypothetical protein